MTNCYKKGVKFCSVDSCMNAGLDICPLTGVKIEYHKFPKDRKLRKLWIRMCTIPTPVFVDDVDGMTICSVHFLRSDYKDSIFSGRKLKKSAYPTLGLNAAWEVHQDFYLQKNNFYYKKNLMSFRKRTNRFYKVDIVSPHLPTKIQLDKTNDDSVPDIHKNYSKWADKFLPLITYPMYHLSDPNLHERLDKLDSYPPWKLPRFPSQELVGSRMNKMCDCKKRNGLQDYCARAMCQGSIQCLKKPYPLCVPSGAWKKNVKPNEAQNIMDWLDSLDNGEKMKCACYNTELCTCSPDFEFKDDQPCRITKSEDKLKKEKSVSIAKQALPLKRSIMKKESSAKVCGNKSSAAVEETKQETKSMTNVKSASSINTTSDGNTSKFASEKSYPLGDVKKSIKSKITNPKCLSIQACLQKNETSCNA